jgi:hypothetical protein
MLWLRFTSCALSLECLLLVLVEYWVKWAGSGLIRGKAGLVSMGSRGCGGGSEGLLNFILEVSENGIKDSISGKSVIIIEVAVISCLSVYVEALYCVLWNCNTCMTSCMLARVCECSNRCSTYLEVWLLCMNECLCSLNLVSKSRPVWPNQGMLSL